MWSAACMFFELLTGGDYMFDPQSGSKYSKDDDHIAQIMELMGEMPKGLVLGGKYSAEFFNRKGTFLHPSCLGLTLMFYSGILGELRHIHKLRYWPLQNVLHDKYLLPAEDADTIASFLNPMLGLNPDRRAKAGVMAAHRWLEGVVVKGEVEVLEQIGLGGAEAMLTPNGEQLVMPLPMGMPVPNVASVYADGVPIQVDAPVVPAQAHPEAGAPTKKKKKGSKSNSKAKSPVKTGMGAALPLVAPPADLLVMPVPGMITLGSGSTATTATTASTTSQSRSPAHQATTVSVASTSESDSKSKSKSPTTQQRQDAMKPVSPISPPQSANSNANANANSMAQITQQHRVPVLESPPAARKPNATTSPKGQKQQTVVSVS